MYYFLTARAHVSETQVFEDYLKLLLPFITKREFHHYSIEEDGSCDRHLHALLEDNAKDTHAFLNKLETKQFKLFWAHLSDKLTLKQEMTNCKPIPKDEVKQTIGYIFKDVNSRQGSSKFQDKKYIQECVELHWTIKRLKAKEKADDIVDVSLVTTKNFYAKVQQFCNKTGTRYDDESLLYKMKLNRYGFINLSRRQKEEGFRELRIMNNQEFKEDKVNVKGEMYENTDVEKEQLMEEMLTLLYADDNFENNLKNLRSKYALYSHNVKSDDSV